eukprot:gb/GFBE01069596.1/.p1 GENE.gb/GFBE01069596.1/~~gb/GFBE01069596.1/.p1  ORF type:complete len:414 (+),score=91.21 gb/GFBE01069596.1/:1-1242(+)
MGVQVQMGAVQAVNEDLESAFRVADSVFACLLILELLLRIIADGKSFFFGVNNLFWNYCDLLLAGMSFTDMIATAALQGESEEREANSSDNVDTVSGIFRVLRILRVVRAIRIVRMVRFISGLRCLVEAIFNTISDLSWALLLLLGLMYGNGLVFTDVVVGYLEDSRNLGKTPMQEETLVRYFGDLIRSMNTLYQAIAGGVDWSDVVWALDDISPFLGIYFSLHVAFCSFAVLNVMTGVFCQTAIDTAQRDQTMLVHQTLNDKEHNVELVRNLFQNIDRDEAGTVTILEFERSMNDPAILALFESLGLKFDVAWTLFKLLDVDGRGVIDIEDFVDGCLRLKGAAKAIDVAVLTARHKGLEKELVRIRREQKKGYLILSELADSFLPGRELRQSSSFVIPVSTQFSEQPAELSS